MTRWRALFLLAAAELAAMSLWFGASAAAPKLAAVSSPTRVTSTRISQVRR